MPFAIAILAGRAREQRTMRRVMHAGDPHLLAVDAPAGLAVTRLAHGARFHMGRIRAVLRLGQAEGHALGAGELAFDKILLLIVPAIIVHHDDDRKIADDRMLVLQIVVQAEPLCREMLANDRHREVRAVLAAILFRQRETQMAGFVGAILGFAQKLLPFRPRQTAFLEIGTRPFATMIEEADVVVGLLERRDVASR